jgi:hypothetical protein
MLNIGFISYARYLLIVGIIAIVILASIPSFVLVAGCKEIEVHFGTADAAAENIG